MIKYFSRASIEKRLSLTSFRGPGFDQIRLAAATVVLLHHCRGVEHPDIQIDPLFYYSGGFVNFGLTAVLVFFAVSGFLVTPGLVRSGNLLEYLVNRSLRIFPALALVVFASILIIGPTLTHLSLRVYFLDPELLVYAKNVLTLTHNYLPGVATEGGRPVIVNGALWTLHFEILSYASLAILSILGVLHRRGLFLVVCAISYVIYVSISLEPSILHLLPNRFCTFIGLFVYFVFGAALFIFRGHIPFSGALAFGACAILLAALPLGVGAVFMPICLPYITIVGGLSALPGSRLMKVDLSYGVYLIHAPIMITVMLLFPGLRIWWVVAAIVFIVVLVLSYLSRTFVEEPALGRKKVISNWIKRHVVTIWGMPQFLLNRQKQASL
jgi:peptidoglycan/LPS O-acetylase OafA/YrhL